MEWKVGSRMGIYFNPKNASFAKDRNDKLYVDKTGLLDYLNEALGTPRNCLAVSHDGICIKKI